MSATLVANARMYAVDPAVATLWDKLFARVGAMSGVPLQAIRHPAPAPLETLWQRDDLGLAFICGYPFATGRFSLQPVAAPVPIGSGGLPAYASGLVVRADSPFRMLEDTFGGRIGWTVQHSQSGFQALRRHLLPYRRNGADLYARSIGPLVTPRRVIEALRDGTIDLGPLDGYWHALLKRHEPETAAALRTLAATQPMPMPLLAASATVPPETVAALREALLGGAADMACRPLLHDLLIEGFAAVTHETYAPLLEQARSVDEAGYPVPA